jgi:hypothetical protein
LAPTLAMKSMNLAARLGDVKWVFAELEKVSEVGCHDDCRAWGRSSTQPDCLR